VFEFRLDCCFRQNAPVHGTVARRISVFSVVLATQYIVAEQQGRDAYVSYTPGVDRAIRGQMTEA
jgi:hypothetical protein